MNSLSNSAMVIKNLCPDGVTPIWNKSQMQSSLVEERLPAWVSTSYSEFVEKLRDPAYPCFWATTAEEKGMIRYAVASSFTEPSVVEQALQAIRMLLAEANVTQQRQDEEAFLQLLLLFFPPEPNVLTLQQYHQQAWDFLNALQALDDTPWPAHVPTDIRSPDWRYVLGGRSLFIIINTPAYNKRRSHNMGSGMSMVFQVEDGLNKPIFDSIIEKTSMKITERLKQYDTTPPFKNSDYAASYVSWFFMPDDNKDESTTAFIYKSMEDKVTGCLFHDKRFQE